MKPSQQTVTFPLNELWNTQGIVSTKEIRYLSIGDIANLLRDGRVRFVIADVGRPLEWIPPEQCYNFYKSKVKARIVEPDIADQGFKLVDFPDEYCYLASEWQASSGEPIILLKVFH